LKNLQHLKSKKVSELLLVSDVDGTLIAREGIPLRNLEAIRRWMDLGGRFSLATGRGYTALERVKEVPVNAPAILLNGGAIIDLSDGKPLWEKLLSAQYRQVVKGIYQHFPEIGIGIWSDNVVEVVQKNELLMDHILREAYRKKLVKIDEIGYNANKVIFAGEPDILKTAVEWIEAQRYDEVGFFYSSPAFYEMVPAGTSKGAALPRLAEICGVPMEHTLAIGNYFNDQTLLETAGTSACPSEAPNPIRALVNFEAGACSNGAVADFIEAVIEVCENR